MRGTLSTSLVATALKRLLALPIEFIPTTSLIDAAWTLRDRFSAGDSLYAVLVIRAGEPLLTTDIRLARTAIDIGIEVRKPVAP